MPQQQMTQIQIRIDTKTKTAVRDILSDMGLDISTAVKMFCKQIEKTRAFPFDVSTCAHSHTMSSKNKRILLNAINEKSTQGKRFSSVKALMADLNR